MLNAPTLEKLHALKLDALAAAWTEQQHQADMTALAFDERLGLLVEAEWLARENKRLIRALQEAKLKLAQACIEAIDYPARRELDKAVIRQLATCRWVEEHHNVILVGATGTGKSFIACALAHQACRKGYRAGYRRAARLFHELALARADGTYVRLLTKLDRLDVLVVDSCGALSNVESARLRRGGERRFGLGTPHYGGGHSACSHSRMVAFRRQAGRRGAAPRACAFASAFRFISRSIVAYRLVVVTLACPSQCAIVGRSTPDCSRWTAVLWRRLCGWSFLCAKVGHAAAAAWRCLARMKRTPNRVRGVPR
jgi:IstB-like ATP binding protein